MGRKICTRLLSAGDPSSQLPLRSVLYGRRVIRDGSNLQRSAC